MVSRKTRGKRGRGTLLKKKAMKKVSAGLITLICTLFTIGLTLEGISLSSLISQPFNLLSIIGLVVGSAAIIAAIGLWREGRKLQNYWKQKKRGRLRKYLARRRDKKVKEKKEKEAIKVKKAKKAIKAKKAKS